MFCGLSLTCHSVFYLLCNVILNKEKSKFKLLVRTLFIFILHCASFKCNYKRLWGFPSDSMVKNLPADAGDAGSILQLGRSPGEGNGNPLQYCCLENPIDRGAWQNETNNNRTSGSASTLGCT